MGKLMRTFREFVNEVKSATQEIHIIKNGKVIQVVDYLNAHSLTRSKSYAKDNGAKIEIVDKIKEALVPSPLEARFTLDGKVYNTLQVRSQRDVDRNKKMATKNGAEVTIHVKPMKDNEWENHYGPKWKELKDFLTAKEKKGITSIDINGSKYKINNKTYELPAKEKYANSVTTKYKGIDVVLVSHGITRSIERDASITDLINNAVKGLYKHLQSKKQIDELGDFLVYVKSAQRGMTIMYNPDRKGRGHEKDSRQAEMQFNMNTPFRFFITTVLEPKRKHVKQGTTLVEVD